ncbi:hypothetical protein [Microvirga terrestris]|uniref:Uncharacterized protein n=1 Tax=Microvirga terrestris TaxID=2791024 RepID=A0ABS0HTB4_9HYPH|nr:hypothetical protein [Microvirga terrestris]MBF9196716.1 hypothetical protein [Microvirga terrestris]
MELEKIIEAIAASTRDEELASATCYEVEAYVRLWPFVFLVNDWDVWNGSKRALKLQVVRWLENQGTAYDFFQIRTGFGLIGVKDQQAAEAFERRWSVESRETPASNRDWNPHPLKSTFEPVFAN